MQITRAHLKDAVERQAWDLLDKLLETDASHIDDNALFTDTWGEWWGLLVHCCARRRLDGVRILMKHGASPDASTWGDCVPRTAREIAEQIEDETFLRLLEGEEEPVYVRKTEPAVPRFGEEDPVNRAGRIREQAGLVFPPEGS